LLLEQPHLKVIANLLVNNKESDNSFTGSDEQTVNHQNIRGQHYYQ